MGRGRIDDDLLDPVVAYDRLAPFYTRVAERRLAYLEAIERLVLDRIPSGSSSYLDVGSGDGRRALRIARHAALREVVLVEPSAAMRRAILSSVPVAPVPGLTCDRGAFDRRA